MPERDDALVERRVLTAVRQHAAMGLLPLSALTVGLPRAEFAARCAELQSGAGPPPMAAFTSS